MLWTKRVMCEELGSWLFSSFALVSPQLRSSKLVSTQLPAFQTKKTNYSQTIPASLIHSVVIIVSIRFSAAVLLVSQFVVLLCCFTSISPFFPALSFYLICDFVSDPSHPTHPHSQISTSSLPSIWNGRLRVAITQQVTLSQQCRKSFKRKQ